MSQTIGTEETQKMLAENENEKQGVPIAVDPVVLKNEVGEDKLGITHEIGGDMISYMKKQSLMQKTTLPDEPSQGFDADGGLKGVKSKNGDEKVSGMNGNEEVHGSATVGGTKVTFP